jgi:anti-sigma B factor antagonist
VVEVSPQDNQYKGIPLLTLSGELEFAIRAELDVALERLFDAGPCLILDLRDVSFMDSSALGLIISLHSRVRERGGGALAIICCYETGVGRVFEATRLVGVLNIFDDLDAAVAYLDSVCKR